MSLFILAYSFCFTNDPKEICYVLADRGENEKSKCIKRDAVLCVAQNKFTQVGDTLISDATLAPRIAF